MNIAAPHRVFNFSPGPAVLPVSVLEQARDELLALPGVGASVLEISHRDKAFTNILEDAQHRLTQLLSIPPGYQVLFLQGGSRLQFSMIPLNLRYENRPLSYILTGSWGDSARKEAEREGQVQVAFSSKSSNYDRLPAAHEVEIDPRSAYVHFTSNETIQGVQFMSEPLAGDVPLVCDASSDFLSRPLPIAQYGLLYACAQKNAGPAGVTIVIIRDDLLARSQDTLPGYLNYRTHAAENSLWNTPPTFGVYLVGLVAKWLQDEIGGLDKMFERNRLKAHLLYEEIDASGGFYRGHARHDSRSLMNVTFRLPSEAIEKKFIAEGEQHELFGLKGHRSVGGIRASIYNAMPMAGVEALRDFMRHFRERNG